MLLMIDNYDSFTYAAAGLMSSLTINGAMAVQLKDMEAGKDPRPMETPKFWAAAFM